MPMFSYWDSVLKELSDTPEEFLRDRGAVLLTRTGREVSFEIVEAPGLGLAVKDGAGHIALPAYIQRELLQLPRLASQIIKVLEKREKDEKRPVKFIDGPSVVEDSSTPKTVPLTGEYLLSRMTTREAGTTQIIQLMAHAGGGKTSLLEHLSRELAKRYVPDPHPFPLILHVDLLGRYVGTIEDAIAGSLNNTYSFAGLFQRQLIIAIRHHWLVLALDGFDELVARVGVRDALAKLRELVEELGGQGCVIVSARAGFFHMREVEAGLRSYFLPKRGDYTFVSVDLQRWGRPQGVGVFEALRVPNAASAIDELLAIFENDESIIFHPFFLTRLAGYWAQGERFKNAAKRDLPSDLARAQYIIEMFVKRETTEKWVNRQGEPLLTDLKHKELLGVVAEEMWRTGASLLSADELSVIAEVALDEFSAHRDIWPEVQRRITTHATIVPRQGQYGFVHTQFFNYYLGYRVYRLLDQGRLDALAMVFADKEISPDTSAWAAFHAAESGLNPAHAAAVLQKILDGAQAVNAVGANIGTVLACLLANHSGSMLEVQHCTFVGEVLREKTYRALKFKKCAFWHCDLSSSKFSGCTFDDCEFGDFVINDVTALVDCVFSDSRFDHVSVGNGRLLFSPEAIKVELGKRGANFRDVRLVVKKTRPEVSIDDAVVDVAIRLVRQSIRSCDLAVEEVEETFGRQGKGILKVGLEVGILSENKCKSVAGSKKTFVRFTIDRDQLLSAYPNPPKGTVLENFWKALQAAFPKQ